MAEEPRDAFVSIEKSLQSMNDTYVAAIKWPYTVYHFLFVNCCFNVFIQDRFQDTTTFEVNVTACNLENSFTLTTKIKLQATCDF